MGRGIYMLKIILFIMSFSLFISAQDKESSWWKKYKEKRKQQKIEKDNSKFSQKSSEVEKLKAELEALKLEKLEAEKSREFAIEQAKKSKQDATNEVNKLKK